jgi:hypothetical protein
MDHDRAEDREAAPDVERVPPAPDRPDLEPSGTASPALI